MSESTRARMYVQSVNLQAGDTAIATLSAVSRGKENAEWSKFTPSGTVTLSLTRDATGAKEFFKSRIGKEVFVDISDAEIPICSQCGEPVETYGTGVHGGNDVGYITGEFVHQECLTAARERLGIS